MGSSGGVLPHLGTIALNTAASAAAAIPAAIQEGPAAPSQIRRHRIDLSVGVTEWRSTFQVATASSAAAKAAIQFSTDNGTTWKYRDGTASGSAPVAGTYVSMAALGTLASPWAAIPAAAKADILLRIVTLDGDGATTGALSGITLQWR